MCAMPKLPVYLTAAGLAASTLRGAVATVGRAGTLVWRLDMQLLLGDDVQEAPHSHKPATCRI